MEIRFRPKEHLDALNNGEIDSFPIGYLDGLFSEICKDKETPEFKSVDYAAGADYMWVYAVIAGVVHAIALGEQINNGFDGWAKLANKIKRLINNTNAIALDRDSLSVLCVNEIIHCNPEINSIKKVIEYETEVPAAYGYGGECEYSKFIEKAQVYYIQGFEVNSKEFILFGARENGDVEVLKQIDIVKYR